MQMKPGLCFLRDNFAKRLKYNVYWKSSGVSNQRPTMKMQDKSHLLVFQLLFHQLQLQNLCLCDYALSVIFDNLIYLLKSLKTKEQNTSSLKKICRGNNELTQNNIFTNCMGQKTLA